MPSLNFNHLRYFWIIAHEGGLTRAAERLNLSQSALSIQIRKLEAQIGHALFDRVGKRLALTEAGRIALDYADTLFPAGDELLGALRGNPAARKQVLRVGALTTLSRNFQLEFVRPLIGRPDVELVVRSGVFRDLLAQLETHELDVVLANAPAGRDAASPLRHFLIDRQPVSLVGRKKPGMRKARFPDILKTTPVLLPALGSSMRSAFDRALERAGVIPTVIAEVDDMAMLRLLARESEGVTLVPPIVVRDELKSKILMEMCRVPGVTEDFYAITPRRKFPNRLLGEILADFG